MIKKVSLCLLASLFVCTGYFTQLDAGKKKNKKTIVQKKNNKNKSKNKKKNNGIDKDLAFLNSIATPKVEEVFHDSPTCYLYNLNQYRLGIQHVKDLMKASSEFHEGALLTAKISDQGINGEKTTKRKKTINQSNKKSEEEKPKEILRKQNYKNDELEKNIKHLMKQILIRDISQLDTWYNRFEKQLEVLFDGIHVYSTKFKIFQGKKFSNMEAVRATTKEYRDFITQCKNDAKILHRQIEKETNSKLRHITSEYDRVVDELQHPKTNKKQNKKRPTQKNKPKKLKTVEKKVTIKENTQEQAPKKQMVNQPKESHKVDTIKTLTEQQQVIAKFNPRIDRWYTKPTEALKETNPDLFSTESQLNQKEIQRKKDTIIAAHALPKELIPYIFEYGAVCDWKEKNAPEGSISYNIPGILVQGKESHDGVFSVGINAQNECFHYSFSKRAYRKVLAKISETRRKHTNKRHFIKKDNTMSNMVVDQGSWAYLSNQLNDTSYIIYKTKQ